MFSLTKYKDDGTKKSKLFEELEDALIEAKTCKETSFEIESNTSESFHVVGEKKDNGYIDWKTVPR